MSSLHLSPLAGRGSALSSLAEFEEQTADYQRPTKGMKFVQPVCAGVDPVAAGAAGTSGAASL